MTTDRKQKSNGLHLSGSIGLLATFGVLLYHLLLRDPVLLGGGQSSPEWLSLILFTLGIGSLAIIYYSTITPRSRGRWAITILGILSQWGLPIALLVPVFLSNGVSVHFWTIVFAAGHVLVAILVVVNVITTPRFELRH